MKTLLSIKTDKEVKQKAQKLAGKLGFPLSTIINAYLREFVRDRSIHFSLEEHVRPRVGRLLKQASEDYRKGKNVAGPFASAKDMDAYLDAP